MYPKYGDSFAYLSKYYVLKKDFDSWNYLVSLVGHSVNTLRTGSFKLFKRPFPGFF